MVKLFLEPILVRKERIAGLILFSTNGISKKEQRGRKRIINCYLKLNHLINNVNMICAYPKKPSIVSFLFDLL